MISPCFPIDLGRPSEIPDHNHQCVIEPATRFEIVQERRKNAIKQRQHGVLEAVEIIGVRIPMFGMGVTEVVKRTHHRHDRHSRLDQTARH